MAMGLMQMGSKGAMRDLDYINPRPPKQSSALPPEVRAKLLGRKAAGLLEAAGDETRPVVYMGSANAAPKIGQSGAGTDWQNPNGHAFVRRRSGVAMSERASRLAQQQGLSRQLIKQQSAQEPLPGGGYGNRPSSREMPPRLPQDGRVASRESGASLRSGSQRSLSKPRAASVDLSIARQRPPIHRMESLDGDDTP